MKTAAQIDALTPTEAQQRMTALGEAFYDTTSWRARFSRDAGIHYQTINKWFQAEKRPTTMAILLLEAWSTLNQADQAVRGARLALQRAPGDISAPLAEA